MAKNICTMCGTGVPMNPGNQVDQPAEYGTILGDPPQQVRTSNTGQVPCLPPPSNPNFVCEPSPPPPLTRIWLLKSSPAPQKSVCLPIGCGPNGGSSSESCGPILICFPPQPKEEVKPKKKELKPVGFISRNKEVDFIGGRLIGGCTCGRKNGLTSDCRRISCQNNPGCLMNPPMCWPQFREPPPPPPPPPDQKMICVPFEVVFQKESEGNS